MHKQLNLYLQINNIPSNHEIKFSTCFFKQYELYELKKQTQHYLRVVQQVHAKSRTTNKWSFMSLNYALTYLPSEHLLCPRYSTMIFGQLLKIKLLFNSSSCLFCLFYWQITDKIQKFVVQNFHHIPSLSKGALENTGFCI